MKMYGGIEAGGTKIVCAVGEGPDNILSEKKFPTTTPEETIGEMIDFFHSFQNENNNELDSIGLGSFGPVGLNRSKKDYGYITKTPKKGWSDTDIVGALESALGIKVIFDTDVNAAAIGEHRWGAAVGLSNFIYLTIGTGVGGGGLIHGKPLHGLVHPEMGHILLPQDRIIDPFDGICPFHGNCLEGMASGPAIHSRWGVPAEQLHRDHPAWDLEAQYLAAALHTLTVSMSPEKIILGGGVMQQEQIFPKLRNYFRDSLAGYVQSEMILDELNKFIVPPILGQRAGIAGSLAMARFTEEYYS